MLILMVVTSLFTSAISSEIKISSDPYRFNHELFKDKRPPQIPPAPEHPFRKPWRGPPVPVLRRSPLIHRSPSVPLRRGPLIQHGPPLRRRVRTPVRPPVGRVN